MPPYGDIVLILMMIIFIFGLFIDALVVYELNIFSTPKNVPRSTCDRSIVSH